MVKLYYSAEINCDAVSIVRNQNLNIPTKLLCM